MPELRADEDQLTISDVVRRATAEFADRTAVVVDDRRITYAQLRDDVARAACSLLAHDVERGDRVAVWAPNSYEWIVMALAIGYVGAVLVPVNTRFKGAEAADIIGRTRATTLVVHNGFLGIDYTRMLRAAVADVATDDSDPVPGLPHLRHVIDLAATGAGSWQGFLAAGVDVSVEAVEQAAAKTSADDVLDIIFTSGTTGRPKGAMSAHRQTIDVARVWAERAEVTADDRYLIVNPFFHTFGYKAGFLVCLLNGATVVPHAVFDLGAILDTIDREGITILPGPPTLYFSMLERAGTGSHDLSTLRLAVTGTTVIPVALIERMHDELSFRSVLTAYGLSEAVVVTMCRPGDEPATIAHTSGIAVAGFEVAVVDKSGRSVPSGTPGEILVRGRNVMLGYFEDPEATAAVVDADGWLHTGDVGYLDERGYLTITDRIKDMFTVGGFNVYPAEIEQLLVRHGDVLEYAVVGVPDDRLGEVGLAYVVPRADRMPDADELIAYCRERLANYKVPRYVRVVTELPRNAAGKVLKTTLRATAGSATGP
jgi:acyl-CoA synthetase (AMP-forming)/AMP-acid ligase II